MARIYSTLFFQGVLSAPTVENTDTVLPGHTWIIRDISVYCNGAAGYSYVNGVIITDNVGAVIFAPGNGHGRGRTLYQWQGREVVPEGGYVTIETIDANWTVRINGYDLSP